ncbi:hypothetical protein SDC9_99906 [bioreactor metagenome]|uniref:Uncharacterized protein n=1 Tax=bioreactor metagenome TaxID=1076179 RepID=A0A645ALE9_9ZZZZ
MRGGAQVAVGEVSQQVADGHQEGSRHSVRRHPAMVGEDPVAPAPPVDPAQGEGAGIGVGLDRVPLGAVDAVLAGQRGPGRRVAGEGPVEDVGVQFQGDGQPVQQRPGDLGRPVLEPQRPIPQGGEAGRPLVRADQGLAGTGPVVGRDDRELGADVELFAPALGRPTAERGPAAELLRSGRVDHGLVLDRQGEEQPGQVEELAGDLGPQAVTGQQEGAGVTGDGAQLVGVQGAEVEDGEVGRTGERGVIDRVHGHGRLLGTSRKG